MSLDADALIDRRRLKRRLAWWRFLAILALVAVVAVGLGRYRPEAPLGFGRHVAVLWVNGLIVSDPDRDQAVYELIENDSVAALLVRINSPGGSTYGSEGLYRALRAVAQAKPVVAVMDGVAASGGYMVAVAADHILAQESSITGSIGVILEATNLTGLLEKLGIEIETVKSAPLKAQPNPFEPMSPEAREAVQTVIADVHDMFVDLVAERRGLGRETVARLADGRIYTGGMAAANGLVDGLGGEREARAWLEASRGISRDLPARELEIDRPDRLLRRLVSAVVGKSYLPERLTLDGLISLWQPFAAD